jgi:WD40 repeat protein
MYGAASNWRSTGTARPGWRTTGSRVWTARLEPAVWPRLSAALDRSGFPEITPGPLVPGAAPRELTVRPLGELVIGWNDVAAAGLAEVFRILDALVRQVGAGAVRSTADELPQVVHWSTVDGPAEAPANSVAATGAAAAGVAAAFGTVAGRPACVVAQDRLRLVSVPGGEPLVSPIDVEAPVRAVALGTEGGRGLLAAAGDDHVIRVWDAHTAAVLHARDGHRGPVTGVASADIGGRAVALSAGSDGDLRAWAGETGEDLGTISGGKGGLTGVRHVRVADDDLLAAGADDGVVRVWSAADGHIVQTFRGHTGWVNDVALLGLGDQGLAASGGADRTVRVWDVSGGRELCAFEHTGSVTGVALTLVAGHPVVGSCSFDGTVRMWDVVTGEALAERQAGDWLTAIAATSGDRPVFVTAGVDGSARLWDATDGLAPRGELTASSVASAIDVTRDDDRVIVVVGHKDGSVRLWEEDGTPRWTLPPSDGAVTAVAFGPAGLVVGTDKGMVRIHDPGTGEELHVLGEL